MNLMTPDNKWFRENIFIKSWKGKSRRSIFNVIYDRVQKNVEKEHKEVVLKNRKKEKQLQVLFSVHSCQWTTNQRK